MGLPAPLSRRGARSEDLKPDRRRRQPPGQPAAQVLHPPVEDCGGRGGWGKSANSFDVDTGGFANRDHSRRNTSEVSRCTTWIARSPQTEERQKKGCVGAGSNGH